MTGQDVAETRTADRVGEPALRAARADRYVGHGRLAGMRAYVAGGDTGTGRAVAVAYAREGADVAIGYQPRRQPGAEEVAALVAEAGRTAVLVPGDLLRREDCEAAVEAAVAGLGGLDVLVNDRLRGVPGSDLVAALWLSRAAGPHLAGGGCVVNTSEEAGPGEAGPVEAGPGEAGPVEAGPGEAGPVEAGPGDAGPEAGPGEGAGGPSAGGPGSAAVNDLTVNLAAELGPQGIRVNAVVPVARDPHGSGNQGGSRRRRARPSAVAAAYVDLAAPAGSAYVTGTVLVAGDVLPG